MNDFALQYIAPVFSDGEFRNQDEELFTQSFNHLTRMVRVQKAILKLFNILSTAKGELQSSPGFFLLLDKVVRNSPKNPSTVSLIS